MGKKEAIGEAAAKVMASQGFYNTKIQSIAEEAGIAVGTIYIYFRSKEEILDYIFTFEHSKRLEILERLLAKEAPLSESLEEFINIHIDRIKEEPYVVKVLIQEQLMPLTCDSEAIKESFARLKKAAEQLILKGQQQGDINKDYNVKFLTEIMFYTLRSLTAAIYDNMGSIDFEDAKKQAVNYIINGLK
jgi:TetR/AcrR family fatty acid metabolism transcriptional regulator